MIEHCSFNTRDYEDGVLTPSMQVTDHTPLLCFITDWLILPAVWFCPQLFWYLPPSGLTLLSSRLQKPLQHTTAHISSPS